MPAAAIPRWMKLLTQQGGPVHGMVHSAAAVTALYHLGEELDVFDRINRALQQARGRLQKRDGLTVGETLLAGIIWRACAPRSKRAFAAWARPTHLPELIGFQAQKLTSEHLWEQMRAVQALAYDTTNTKAQLPRPAAAVDAGFRRGGFLQRQPGESGPRPASTG